MKKVALLLVVGVLLAGVSHASEYATFTRDLVKPYDYFKKSLSLTSKKEDAEKAKTAVASFVESWSVLAAKYSNDVPGSLSKINDFSARINRPVEVGKQAAEYLKSGNVGRAHTVLEEVRYLMWEMRVKSGIVSLSDKANDFHEAMEILLEHSAVAKEPEDAQRVYERYAAWFLIKWDDHANATDIASVKKSFDPALEEGRKAIVSYLDALKKGDVALAKELSGGVKNAYKKLWALDNQ
jgi:hypothetical protein